MKHFLFNIGIFFLSTLSFSQSIEKFSIDSGGASASAGGIQILYTIGEVNVQEYSTSTLSVSEGFINPQQLIIKIDPKIFLEGPYNAGIMLDGLRSTGNIPTTSPYIDGLTTNSSVFSVTGTDAIIDWVWIEIRDSTDGTTVINSTSALLQADGDVVSTDGIAAITVNVPEDNYYIMISHRNHLGVRTANTINLIGGTQSIDLTADSALIEGGTNAIADLGDGNLALFSGDFDGNGQVQNSDKIAVEILRGTNGFSNADLDMNSEVQNTDIQNKLNPNIGKGEQFASRSLKLYAKRKKQ